MRFDYFVDTERVRSDHGQPQIGAVLVVRYSATTYVVNSYNICCEPAETENRAFLCYFMVLKHRLDLPVLFNAINSERYQ